MRKDFVIMGLISLALTTSSCASQQQVFGYEMTCLGVGTEGSNLLKVYSYGKTYDKSVEQAKHDAVHGILFKGIVGSNGCANQPAMVKPQEQVANQAFFDDFFKKGEYLRFEHLKRW